MPAALLLTLTTLGVLALFLRPALMLWLTVLGAYGLFNLAASVASAARGGAILFPMLPAVVACYHFGYGYGFWRGFMDFTLLRKGGRPCFATLTRTA